jgi:peptidoglycan/LPS O-acetylase OafA/YrhL
VISEAGKPSEILEPALPAPSYPSTTALYRSSSRVTRIDGLDLLRGIAVALVVVHHGFPTPFSGSGVVGVVMFFALSGYLITGSLAGELGRDGKLNYRRFYLRRVRRLVPALLLLVVGFVIVTLIWDPIHDRGRLLKTVLVALTWTGDLPFGHGSDATFHLWTLAMEEQFYLVWPAVLAFAWIRQRVTTALIVAAAACLLACTATLVWLAGAPDLAYALPTSWAVCFVIGAAVRLNRDRLSTPRWAAPAALGALLVLSVIALRGHVATYLVAAPAIAALTGVLLVAWRNLSEVRSPALRPLVQLGTVSYGAYLWNYPITLWLRPYLGGWTGIVAVVLTVAAAAFSWHFVERRFQHTGPPGPVRI